MRARRRWELLIAAALTAGSLTACSGRQSAPLAVAGVVDLTGWDFEHDGGVRLRGEWRFEWQELADPDTLVADPPADFLALPGVWKGYGPTSGRRDTGPAEGWATFALELRGIDPQRWTQLPLAVELAWAYTAYELHSIPLAQARGTSRLDLGEPLISNGSVASRASDHRGQYRVARAAITLTHDATLLIVYVSNFDHGLRGGLAQPIVLGTEHDLSIRARRAAAIGYLSLGMILFVGGYYLLFFVRRRKERSALALALLCFDLVAILLLRDSFLLALMEPGRGPLLFEWQNKLDYIANGAVAFFTYFFFRSLYPQQIPRWGLQLVAGITGGYVLLILLAPLRVYSVAAVAVGGLMALAAGVVFVGLWRAIRARRAGASASAVGYLFYAAAGGGDLLGHNWLLDFPALIFYGFLVFVLTQAWILANRSVTAFATAERAQQELQIQIARVTADLRRVFTSLNHDMRNPISSILGFTDLLLGDALGPIPARAKDRLARVHSNGTRLLRLVDNLLALEAQPQLALEECSIAAIITAVTSDMEALAVRKGLALNTDLAPDVPAIRADREELTRLVANLVDNAIKYTDAGSVVVAAGRDGPWLLVEVRDTGVGVPEAEIEQIFSDGVRAVDGTFAPSGAGLGLAIAQRIARHHGGELAAHSIVGRGTTFTLRLPVDQPATPKARATQPTL